MDYFDSLNNDWLVQEIIRHCGCPHDLIGLRGTCKRFHALVPNPKHYCDEEVMMLHAVEDDDFPMFMFAVRSGACMFKEAALKAAHMGRYSIFRAIAQRINFAVTFGPVEYQGVLTPKKRTIDRVDFNSLTSAALQGGCHAIIELLYSYDRNGNPQQVDYSEIAYNPGFLTDRLFQLQLLEVSACKTEDEISHLIKMYWSDRTSDFICACGQALISMGMKINDMKCVNHGLDVLKSHEFDTFRWRTLAEEALLHSNAGMYKFAISHEYSRSFILEMVSAIESGNVEMCQLAISNGCKLDYLTVSRAMLTRKALPVFRWLDTIGMKLLGDKIWGDALRSDNQMLLDFVASSHYYRYSDFCGLGEPYPADLVLFKSIIYGNVRGCKLALERGAKLEDLAYAIQGSKSVGVCRYLKSIGVDLQSVCAGFCPDESYECSQFRAKMVSIILCH